MYYLNGRVLTGYFVLNNDKKYGGKFHINYKIILTYLSIV